MRRNLSTYGVIGVLAAGAAAVYLYGATFGPSLPDETGVARAAVVFDYALVPQNASYQTPPKSDGLSAQRPRFELQESSEPLLAISVKPLRSPWTANKDIRDHAKVLTMNNFDWEYIQGGVIPREGAEISVVADVSQKTIPPVDALIADYLKGDVRHKVTKAVVAGCEVRQVESETELAPFLVYKRIAVFMPVRHKDSVQVYKFVLSHHANEKEPLTKSFREAFEQVLKSAAIIAPSTTKCSYPTTSTQ